MSGPAKNAMPDAVLSRALLETGGLEVMLCTDAPALTVLSEGERQSSLDAVLAARPGGDLWLFAYGSLLWNPTVRSVEWRVARAEGWHRAFCLSIVAGRGSPERPGLALALVAGGSCDGLALRIAECDIEAELVLLWRREMVTGAYVPRWLELLDRDGRRFGTALAFTIDGSSKHYVAGMSAETIVQLLATGAGSLGSSAEYLLRTRNALRHYGIPDPMLEDLAKSVSSPSFGRLG